MDELTIQQLTSALRELIDELRQQTAEERDLQEGFNEAIEEQNTLLQDQKRYLDNIVKTSENVVTRQGNIREELETINQLLQDQENLSESEIAALKEKEEILKEQLLQLQEQGKQINKNIESLKKYGSFAVQTFSNLSNVISSIGSAINTYAGFDFTGAFSMQNAQQTTLRIDALGKSLTRTTGLSSNLTNSVRNLGIEMAKFGVLPEDIAQSFTALQQSFSDFTRLDQEEMERITRLSNEFFLAGVDYQNTAGAFQIATRVMGQTNKQAEELTEDLIETATSIRMQPDLIINSFIRTTPRLAVYGRDQVRIFKAISEQVKATGVDYETIIGISEGFKTFESATTAAAMLRAQFGVQLDSMELMLAGPEEALKILQEGFEAAGVAIGDLQEFEMRSLSAILKVPPDTLLKLGQAKDSLKELKAEMPDNRREVEDLISQNLIMQKQIEAFSSKTGLQMSKRLESSFRALVALITEEGEFLNKSTKQAGEMAEKYAGLMDGARKTIESTGLQVALIQGFKEALNPLINIGFKTNLLLTGILFKSSISPTGGPGGGIGGPLLPVRGQGLRGGAKNLAKNLGRGAAQTGTLTAAYGAMDAYSDIQSGEDTTTAIGKAVTGIIGALALAGAVGAIPFTSGMSALKIPAAASMLAMGVGYTGGAKIGEAIFAKEPNQPDTSRNNTSDRASTASNMNQKQVDELIRAMNLNTDATKQTAEVFAKNNRETLTRENINFGSLINS